MARCLALALASLTFGSSCDEGSTRRDEGASRFGDPTPAAVTASPAPAADLVVYYSWSDRTARVLLDEFTAATGVSVSGMRRSSRHLVKLIEAEMAAPMASAVFSGPAPSYVMLKQAGLLQRYRPAGSEAIPAEFRDPDGTWTGIYLGVIAFGTDGRFVDAIPSSYEDLLRMELPKGLVYANPATSGTTYTFLLGLIAWQGEQGAFDYLARLHPKVQEVPSGGAMTLQLVNLGEASVAVAFAHDVLLARQHNPHLELSFPAEGAGWEVGCAGLLKGAPNPRLAQRFLDFLAQPHVQEIMWRKAGFPVYPTHPEAEPPPGAPPFDSVERVAIDVVDAGRRWDERALRWNRRFPRRR